MPKISQLEKCKHPNSRKTKALVKQINKKNARQKIKLGTNIKLNILGEKVLWFRDNINTESSICTATEVKELIEKYLSRFNEELEQIQLKHSIGNRKNRQHASREDIIKLSIKREREEYNTSGIEIPDLLDPVQFSVLRNWNGELRFLQNFKLKRYNKPTLDGLENKSNKVQSDNSTMDVNS